MNEKTKPIEDILDQLAGICYDTVQNNETIDLERVDALAKSLSTNGWKRHSENEPPLAVQIEQRAIALGGDEVENHREQITATAEKIAKAYHRYSDFDTSVPETDRDQQGEGSTRKGEAWRTR